MPNEVDLTSLNNAIARLSQNVDWASKIFEKVVEDLGIIAETFKMTKDDTWVKIGISGCDCPWNNQWGPPGILPPHHASCPTRNEKKDNVDGS